MRATISSDGLKFAIAEQNAMGHRASHGNLLDDSSVRHELEHASGRRFRRGLKQAGSAWRLEKRRRGLPDRPMQASRTAFKALTQGSGPGASAIVFKGSGDGVTWGVKPGRSELYHVEVLAKGYRTTHGRVTPRRVVVVDKQARRFIAERVVRVITGQAH